MPLRGLAAVSAAGAAAGDPFWGHHTRGLGAEGARMLRQKTQVLLWCILLGCWDFNPLPTNGFSIKPLNVKLLAGSRKQPRLVTSNGAPGLGCLDAATWFEFWG